MARNADFVEELVQLVDDGGDLLLQVRGIHCRGVNSPAARAVPLCGVRGKNA